MKPQNLKQISDYIFEIPEDSQRGMLVPARIFATKKLIDEMDDAVFAQICNMAALPGIVKYAMCMPDGHSGYGFPIGGAAAVDPDNGVITPGGIGYDINCGVRLTATDITIGEIKPRIKEIIDRFFADIPSGTGAGALLNLNKKTMEEAVSLGAGYAVKLNLGVASELEFIEELGRSKYADPSAVSDIARERGMNQCGSLGSGNHYLELQVVHDENIFDRETAAAYGIRGGGQIVYMIHCGSRGFGHQIATDYIKLFNSVMTPKYGIRVPDRELACAPFKSDEGQRYFKAMNCAVNYAFLNRHLIDQRARAIISKALGVKDHKLGARLVYDVCHNTAKLEQHLLDGKEKTLLVHRKGATRSLPPGTKGLPEGYAKFGQPVLIGGSMETGSYLMAGMPSSSETFFTTCHGSGRVMSRGEAKRKFNGRDLIQKMLSMGIYIQTASYSALAEEAGAAYKDLNSVIASASGAGLSRPVARMVPIGNIKG